MYIVRLLHSGSSNTKNTNSNVIRYLFISCFNSPESYTHGIILCLTNYTTRNSAFAGFVDPGFNYFVNHFCRRGQESADPGLRGERTVKPPFLVHHSFTPLSHYAWGTEPSPARPKAAPGRRPSLPPLPLCKLKHDQEQASSYHLPNLSQVVNYKEHMMIVEPPLRFC